MVAIMRDDLLMLGLIGSNYLLLKMHYALRS
jgi:hypothetical protein